MKPQEFLKMMVQDNETRTEKKELYSEVIDCMEIALSQTPSTAEIDGKKDVEGAFKLIQEAARKSPNHCCGPFRAAEIIAEYLGVKYCRATKKYSANPTANVSLDDYF